MATTTEETPPEPKVQPNIDAIILLLQAGGELDEAAKKKQDGASAEGTIFQRIEKNLHGNRAAVSDIRKIRKWAKDKQADYIRTLEPLLVHFGLTLEAIDPEDLVARAQVPVEPNAGTGSNGAVNALDAARTTLTGDDTGAAQERAAAATGSVQLRKFLGGLRADMTFDEAREYAELEEGEAKLHQEAEQRGEWAHIEVIPPPKKRTKPKLGIVGGAAAGGGTVQ